MSIDVFLVVLFVGFTVVATILLTFFLKWIKKDAARREDEIAHPERYLRR